MIGVKNIGCTHTDCASTRLLNILRQPKIQKFIADHEKEKETSAMTPTWIENTNNGTESDEEENLSFEETLSLFKEQADWTSPFGPTG
jgi:hypothetical protein